MKEDNIILSNGRKIYAHLGLVSINYDERGRTWRLGEGYDGEINLEDFDVNGDEIPEFTREELIELADHIIERWNQFKFDVREGKVFTK